MLGGPSAFKAKLATPLLYFCKNPHHQFARSIDRCIAKSSTFSASHVTFLDKDKVGGKGEVIATSMRVVWR